MLSISFFTRKCCFLFNQREGLLVFFFNIQRILFSNRLYGSIVFNFPIFINFCYQKLIVLYYLQCFQFFAYVFVFLLRHLIFRIEAFHEFISWCSELHWKLVYSWVELFFGRSFNLNFGTARISWHSLDICRTRDFNFVPGCERFGFGVKRRHNRRWIDF